MVKKLDEKSGSWPDHLGWDLWLASLAWQRDFVSGMRAAGHSWMSEARATLLGHIPMEGIAQAALMTRMGTTKQAVQQLVDGLEAEGIVHRLPDPKDRRARRVAYTEKGREALEDANRIKADIESRYRARLGGELHGALKTALALIVQKER